VLYGWENFLFYLLSNNFEFFHYKQLSLQFKLPFFKFEFKFRSFQFKFELQLLFFKF